MCFILALIFRDDKRRDELSEYNRGACGQSVTACREICGVGCCSGRREHCRGRRGNYRRQHITCKKCCRMGWNNCYNFNNIAYNGKIIIK